MWMKFIYIHGLEVSVIKKLPTSTFKLCMWLYICVMWILRQPYLYIPQCSDWRPLQIMITSLDLCDFRFS